MNRKHHLPISNDCNIKMQWFDSFERLHLHFRSIALCQKDFRSIAFDRLIFDRFYTPHNNSSQKSDRWWPFKKRSKKVPFRKTRFLSIDNFRYLKVIDSSHIFENLNSWLIRFAIWNTLFGHASSIEPIFDIQILVYKSCLTSFQIIRNILHQTYFYNSSVLIKNIALAKILNHLKIKTGNRFITKNTSWFPWYLTYLQPLVNVLKSPKNVERF